MAFFRGAGSGKREGAQRDGTSLAVGVVVGRVGGVDLQLGRRAE